MAQRRTVRFVAVSTVAGLVVATGAVAAAGPWDGGQRKAERDRAAAGTRAGGGDHGGAGRAGGAGAGRRAAPPVLGALGGGAARAAGLAGVLDPLLKDAALGPEPSAAVYDAGTGERLYGAGQDTGYTPASTIKLATAAAALAALGPEHRIETTVVAGSDGVVLVGGGDPTLTARPVKGEGPRFASLGDLADATVKALKARGTTRTRLAYDASRYSGPPLHPIGPNENLAPVSALMADEGRLDDSDRGVADRTAEPAADAARKFAAMLRERGVEVEGEPAEGRADAKAERLATVSSAPLADLVERALTNSDNDVAEALARQTALASGRPASFEGAAQAVTERLTGLGLPMAGVHIADGSGLDRSGRASADFLARLLLRSASADSARLRPVLTGLPVAGFTGTLRERYGREVAGRASVRAKTGTLTGVNTLAGTAVTAGGRLLVFAFMASGTADAGGAQQALDRLASALAEAG
ncbi:D-alanyl-D-alanine carboxypeptidase/D-alanyl-D-alanine-endopeptidase [Streptomyces cinnamoneus]|uniref:D-alanyl-D-alanine carboxypeptidase/D-alanyl-D-alanine-endopeptidase n=1 Tax=Streptomyces cinnamoneus TaxID=53446 RepID=A0A2G1XIA6_STRCJ|nr:D-alanyl-D-alanine carboxypeptidase/D-alanyl-D-alanine-endopeptidase [Streptomyces cinnamoneus]PHQ50859.1 D-alanyl-D-alanine carboxypeptidase/D-alanyl-D-alanine-endopeptidase [Streptomyces cinnamoneus]PPT16613.1 D-alanyl-D-alanine carboxypeptidase/D-alanyl-D-alanine-endopeptidase [Streptomyces cinnamoneus]